MVLNTAEAAPITHFHEDVPKTTEKHIPEVPKLKNLEDLFLPKGEIENEQIVKEASTEIIQKLKLPVTNPSGINEITQNSERGRAIESLNFLDNFCEFRDKAELTVKKEKNGGIKLTFKPTKDSNRSNFGLLDTHEVKKVEIIVRTGENDDKNEENGKSIYTPMQLNIKMIGSVEEIFSHRVDVHNTKDRTDRIEIDAWESRDNKHKHLPIETLNKTDNPQENFRTLQKTFIINIVENLATSMDEKGRLVMNKNIEANPENKNKSRKTLEKTYKQSRNALGMEKSLLNLDRREKAWKEAVQREINEQEYEATWQELEKATKILDKAINQVDTSIFTTIVESEEDKRAAKYLSDKDIFLSWLVDIPPAKISTKGLKDLNIYDLIVEGLEKPAEDLILSEAEMKDSLLRELSTETGFENMKLDLRKLDALKDMILSIKNL